MSDTELNVGDERVVEIGPIAHGGHFIAHSDGRTLFVRHAITGETARVRVTSSNRKIVRADAIEILTPSPDRIPAPCAWAHAEGCGGCDFQHVVLPAQRRLKTQVLRDSLVRLAGLPAEEVDALPLDVRALPGDTDGLHWRTRVQWTTASDGRVGLLRHRSHDVIAVDECLIAVPEASRPASTDPAKVTREVRGRTWKLASDEFWQVHAALPEALLDAVLEFADAQPGSTWWDLYSGAGHFAAFLGEAVGVEGRVVAVEGSEEGSRAARRAMHDLPQVQLQHAEVGAWIRASDHDAPDGIVLDPPRAGAGQAVVAAIANAGVPTVVYVACDPAALARDVAQFATYGYRLASVAAFDAFPMTHHFETVALLVERNL